jgi:hypothetical protein
MMVERKIKKAEKLTPTISVGRNFCNAPDGKRSMRHHH